MIDTNTWQIDLRGQDEDKAKKSANSAQAKPRLINF